MRCARPPPCRRAGRSSASGPGAFRGRARRLGPWAPRPAPALPSRARVAPLHAGGHYRGGRGPPAAARSWLGRAGPHSGEAPEQAARLRPPQERRTQRSASSPGPSKMTIKRRRAKNIAQASIGTQEQAVRHGRWRAVGAEAGKRLLTGKDQKRAAPLQAPSPQGELPRRAVRERPSEPLLLCPVREPSRCLPGGSQEVTLRRALGGREGRHAKNRERIETNSVPIPQNIKNRTTI